MKILSSVCCFASFFFRMGKLAPWLASHVTSSFMHIWPTKWARWHFGFSLRPHFGVLCVCVEFMTCSWCLWRADWFLWNSLDLVYGNISCKQAIAFVVLMQSVSHFSPPDIHCFLFLLEIYCGIKIQSQFWSYYFYEVVLFLHSSLPWVCVQN